jgi:hypothetical protein
MKTYVMFLKKIFRRIKTMNEQDMMTTNEVMEVTEVTSSSSGNGLAIAIGLVVVGGLIYGGTKLIRKIQAKKKGDGVITVKTRDVEDDECDAEDID